ncbi:hypothetical protein PWT90_01707 [Aphanocladium album]|nr:hypothetical protein PWT90_01707 [Aphanocladium album]
MLFPVNLINEGSKGNRTAKMTMQLPAGNPEAVFPNKYATAEQIQTFVIHLLEARHGVNAAEASDIAEHWRLDRGSDFLSAKASEFQEIFGYQAGPYLYTTVQDVKEMLWRQTTEANVFDSLGQPEELIILEFLFPFTLATGILWLYARIPEQAGRHRKEPWGQPDLERDGNKAKSQ